MSGSRPVRSLRRSDPALSLRLSCTDQGGLANDRARVAWRLRSASTPITGHGPFCCVSSIASPGTGRGVPSKPAGVAPHCVPRGSFYRVARCPIALGRAQVHLKMEALGRLSFHLAPIGCLSLRRRLHASRSGPNASLCGWLVPDLSARVRGYLGRF